MENKYLKTIIFSFINCFFLLFFEILSLVFFKNFFNYIKAGLLLPIIKPLILSNTITSIIFITSFIIVNFTLVYYIYLIIYIFKYSSKNFLLLKNNEYNILNYISIYPNSNINQITDSFLYKYVIYFLIFFIYVFYGIFVAFPFSPVQGHSMEKTLHDGDCVFLLYGISSKKKNDIVSCIYPKSVYIQENTRCIKRIVATPDSKLYFKRIKNKEFYNLFVDNKLVSVNNKTLILEKQEIYNICNIKEDKIFDYLEFIIPKSKYLVIGDNYNHSSDSRLIGLLDDYCITGKVLFNYCRRM